ncbi:hypothetical protein SLEP1_g39005 [Rubroshorea leprosula]|uniref:Uncharacterized protein n=1 Tax=Rubroshorea leprosula TaxID=152421 RepID=A0AAV5KZ75_9ROSI|nr:hypothetical protein SLEP1_g39005 [Rubroshorea leprosula]
MQAICFNPHLVLDLNIEMVKRIATVVPNDGNKFIEEKPPLQDEVLLLDMDKWVMLLVKFLIPVGRFKVVDWTSMVFHSWPFKEKEAKVWIMG